MEQAGDRAALRHSQQKDRFCVPDLQPDRPAVSALKNVELPMLYAGVPARQRTRRAPPSCWPWWRWTTGAATSPASSRAARSSGWPLPGPWPTTRTCCWPTSPPALWTARPAAPSWIFSTGCTGNRAKPSCSSPTTRPWPRSASGCSPYRMAGSWESGPGKGGRAHAG